MRRYLIFGALAVVAIAAGFSRRARPVDPPAARRMAEPLILTVNRDGVAVRLLWDPSKIGQATYGELSVSDGGQQSKLPLNSALLSSGSFSYIPVTRDVSFRLEIPGEPAVSGVVKVPEGSPVPATVEPAAPPPPDPDPPKPNRPKARRKATVPKPAEAKPSPFPEADAVLPETRVELPEARSAPPVQVGAPPPVGSAPSSRSVVSMAVEPAPPSTIGRVVGTVGRLPLLRRLRKSTEATVPPKATFQATPVISVADRRTLTAPLVVDVRVTVDETGKVESAEAVGDSARHAKFATAAAAAARRWRFAPARSGETPVSAKLLLHFRFQPADQ